MDISGLSSITTSSEMLTWLAQHCLTPINPVMTGSDLGTILQKIISTSVASVNGQTGAISLTSDDISEGSTNKYFTDARVATYSDTRYAQLSGSYINPSWITSLPWNKITSTPTTLAGYGITDGALASDIALRESLSNKNIANGYAGLNSSGLLPLTLFPDKLLGNVKYKGTYNGVSNIITSADPVLNGQPLPASIDDIQGYYFINTADFTLSGVGYKIGDWIISNGTSGNWNKVDNSDAVTTVFGRNGNIVANAGDYNTSQVTESGNLYYTDARVANYGNAHYVPYFGAISNIDFNGKWLTNVGRLQSTSTNFLLLDNNTDGYTNLILKTPSDSYDTSLGFSSASTANGAVRLYNSPASYDSNNQFIYSFNPNNSTGNMSFQLSQGGVNYGGNINFKVRNGGNTSAVWTMNPNGTLTTDADYSANFTSESYVTKRWVEAALAGDTGGGSTFEVVANKETIIDFSTANDTTYPTTAAVANFAQQREDQRLGSTDNVTFNSILVTQSFEADCGYIGLFGTPFISYDQQPGDGYSVITVKQTGLDDDLGNYLDIIDSHFNILSSIDKYGQFQSYVNTSGAITLWDLTGDGLPGITWYNNDAGNSGILKAPSVIGDWTWTLPNKSGTIALLEDIAGGGSGSFINSQSTAWYEEGASMQTGSSFWIDGVGAANALYANGITLGDFSDPNAVLLNIGSEGMQNTNVLDTQPFFALTQNFLNIRNYALHGFQVVVNGPGGPFSDRVTFGSNVPIEFGHDYNSGGVAGPVRLVLAPVGPTDLVRLQDITNGYVPYTGATTDVNLGTHQITASQYRLSALNTAPTSATDTGTTGEIRVTAGYIYICTTTNTWVRSALSTF